MAEEPITETQTPQFEPVSEEEFKEMMLDNTADKPREPKMSDKEAIIQLRLAIIKLQWAAVQAAAPGFNVKEWKDYKFADEVLEKTKNHAK